MRELQVCVSKRQPAGEIGRLEFSADGSELVAWVGDDEWDAGDIRAVYACDLRTDDTRLLFGADNSHEWIASDVVNGFALSPDHRLLALNLDFDEDSIVVFIEPVD